MPLLSKSEVARRTLREAIRLFFEERDDVVVHTVVGAAQAMLRDLAKSRKLSMTSVLHDHPALKQEHQRDWHTLLNGPRNFFKHADQDPDDTIEFDGVYNDIFLLDSVANFIQLGIEPLHEVLVCAAWIELRYPSLRGAFPGNPVLDECVAAQVDPANKTLFRRLCESEA